MNETAILVSLARSMALHIPRNGAVAYCGITRPHTGWDRVVDIAKVREPICQNCIKERERSMYVNQRS